MGCNEFASAGGTTKPTHNWLGPTEAFTRFSYLSLRISQWETYNLNFDVFGPNRWWFIAPQLSKGMRCWKTIYMYPSQQFIVLLPDPQGLAGSQHLVPASFYLAQFFYKYCIGISSLCFRLVDVLFFLLSFSYSVSYFSLLYWAVSQSFIGIFQSFEVG